MALFGGNSLRVCYIFDSLLHLRRISKNHTKSTNNTNNCRMKEINMPRQCDMSPEEGHSPSSGHPPAGSAPQIQTPTTPQKSRKPSTRSADAYARNFNSNRRFVSSSDSSYIFSRGTDYIYIRPRKETTSMDHLLRCQRLTLFKVRNDLQ